MADRRIRELERLAAAGDVDASAALMRLRMRNGDLDVSRVELAAYCLDPLAWRALDWPGEPGTATVNGTRVSKVPGETDAWLRNLPDIPDWEPLRITEECPECLDNPVPGKACQGTHHSCPCFLHGAYHNPNRPCARCRGSKEVVEIIKPGQVVAVRAMYAICDVIIQNLPRFYGRPAQAEAERFMFVGYRRELAEKALKKVEDWLRFPGLKTRYACANMAHSGEPRYCEWLLIQTSRNRESTAWESLMACYTAAAEARIVKKDAFYFMLRRTVRKMVVPWALGRLEEGKLHE